MLHLRGIEIMDNTYKDYRIEMDKSFPLWLIKPKAQGQVPTALRGRYTSVPEAKKDIDKYEHSKPVKKKAVKNGKSINTSGD